MAKSSFQTTCWTHVLCAARRGDGHEARRSLEVLCERYWYPLYAYLRRQGHSVAAAEDYVQGFFADLLARGSLQSADPDRGRFRSFLLASCKNFVANEQRAAGAVKRGGGKPLLSLDVELGERRYSVEPVDHHSAERLFDRRWALETIDAALDLLRERYAESGKEDRFERLRPLIAPAEEAPPLSVIAQQLGMSEGAVKVAAHRLRNQFAAALRDLVAITVDMDPKVADGESGVDRELSELLKALAN